MTRDALQAALRWCALPALFLILLYAGREGMNNLQIFRKDWKIAWERRRLHPRKVLGLSLVLIIGIGPVAHYSIDFLYLMLRDSAPGPEHLL